MYQYNALNPLLEIQALVGYLYWKSPSISLSIYNYYAQPPQVQPKIERSAYAGLVTNIEEIFWEVKAHEYKDEFW